MNVHSIIIHRSQKCKQLSGNQLITGKNKVSIHMLQGKWIMGALCFVKEGSHMKSWAVWFHFYDMSRIGEIVETEGWSVVVTRWEKNA